MEEQKFQLKKGIAWRIKALHLVFTGVVIYFLFHIFTFTLFNKEVAESLDEVRKVTIVKSEPVIAYRGTILSRDGRLLAKSITRKILRFDFGCDKFLKMTSAEFRTEAKELSVKLADYFGDRSAKEYYDEIMKCYNSTILFKVVPDTIVKREGLLRREVRVVTSREVAYRNPDKKKRYRAVKLFREVDMNEWDQIRTFPLLCYGNGNTYSVEDCEHRVYPQGDIALRTIGRWEHHRTYGVELAMRDTLKGHNGKQWMQTISPGYKARIADSVNIEARNGYDVVTTLDIDVQDVANNALAEQLVAQSAMWGTTIVMECSTGDILAMANLRREGNECVEVQNYAIGVPVNPGSTFKLVSAMALLEHRVPTSQKYHSGLGKRVEVGGAIGATVQDSHAIAKESGGVIDMRRAFSESANVYFTKAIYEEFKDKPVEFSNFCRGLHLGETIGLEGWGARSKSLPHLDRRHPSRINALVNMAYGYGLEVTPLHTLALYNAVANNGKMVAPRLILRTERDGEVVSEAPVRVIEEQICSKSTLDTLRSFMEEVSLMGTAAEYFGEKKSSFRTGSKTGTAQVDSEINGVRYKKGDGYYYGSMVTYLPADNPRYTIMTAIFTKKQSGKPYYGAGLSGPVQKRVATFLHNRDIAHAETVDDGEYYATAIKGGNIEKIRKVANEYGGKYTSEGRHGWGGCAPSQSDGKLHISQMDMVVGVVPNVVGMGLDDALFLLENQGLVVEVVGCGKVVKQSLKANTKVEDTDKRIKIELR